jgi:hypothetical protein
MKKLFDFLKNLSPKQSQTFVYYSCIGGAATIVSLVVWNVVFAGSTSSVTNGAAPTEKMLTGPVIVLILKMPGMRG